MLALPPRFQHELEKAHRKPFALLQIDSAGQTATATTEANWNAATSESNADHTSATLDLQDAAYRWTASGGGTNEYYCELSGGGDPSIEERFGVSMSNVPLVRGTVGSLSDHEWDYGDNDTLGYSTIYVRDDTGDPDVSGVTIYAHATVPTGDVQLGGQNITTCSNTAPPTSDVLSYATGTYADIDEFPYNDTDYITQSQSDTATDEFRGAVASASVETILAEFSNYAQIASVMVVVRARHGADDSSGWVKGSITIGGTTYKSAQIATTTSYANYQFQWTTDPSDAGESWTKNKIRAIQNIGCEQEATHIGDNADIFASQVYLTVKYLAFNTTGSITVQLDLTASANTANSATISIDDRVPSSTTLKYTAEGSTSGAWGGEEVALGAVEDGSSVTGYRYYRITAAFTGDGSDTARLKSISATIPKTIYKFSTLSDDTLSAIPLIQSIPGRTISIDLKSMVTTTSDLSVQLTRTDYVDELVRGNYFRGLNATMRIGMWTPDVTADDLLLYYTGTVADYGISEEVVTINLSDATKDLDRKVPEGTAPSTAVSTAYNKTNTPYNMVDVILDLIDKAGVAIRYVDRGSFETVKLNVGDGTPAPDKYVVYRGTAPPEDPGSTWDTTITKADACKKVAGEILELMACYIVVQEGGKITCVEYDSSTAASATWDDNVIFQGASYDPGLKSLRNQCYVYYDWDGLGDDDGINYHSVYIVADATSAANWNITATKIIKSKWLAGDATDGYHGDDLAAEIAAREVTRLKDGVGKFTCRTSLDQCHIQVGDFITIDSPLVINPDVGKDSTRKFMVTKKTWDIDGGTMSWELTEAR